jgi:methylmalonyl-CoA mutase N-terminal domain/subunit
VNAYTDDGGESRIELHRLDPEAVRRQVGRTARVRAERDAAAVTTALEAVGAAARGTENMLPPIRAALAAHCTVGEVCGTLREEWGSYR